MEANQLYFFYGYSAAWIIVLAYVLMLVRRGRRIDSELTRLKSLVEDKDR
ncbi:MAG TPA: CcmD family protein [Bryobacteraceae bacterium]|nr:CcmD family protein [Bryobacteraceae bacterium]